MISSFSKSGTADGGSIVVGWDRTPAARAALREAIDLAARLHARLHIAHIADDSDLGIDPDSPTWEAQTRARSDATAQWVRSLLAGVGTGWTYYSARGSAASVLISNSVSGVWRRIGRRFGAGDVARPAQCRPALAGRHRSVLAVGGHDVVGLVDAAEPADG